MGFGVAVPCVGPQIIEVVWVSKASTSVTVPQIVVVPLGAMEMGVAKLGE